MHYILPWLIGNMTGCPNIDEVIGRMYSDGGHLAQENLEADFALCRKFYALTSVAEWVADIWEQLFETVLGIYRNWSVIDWKLK